MIRNILRTSRWLARRQINTLTPVVQYTSVKTLKYSSSTVSIRRFATPSDNPQSSEHIEPAVFEEICNETLESLCDYFEQLVDETPDLKGADVTYSDGVLTVVLGPQYGTYVINRQTPNKQIWLSSPVSGPKRYDLVLKDGGYWVYKHDGIPLHRLLQNEISKIVKNKVEFHKCAHSIV
ncbi:frataxin homolog, mitochondrial isoform X2 [Pectinophora gossypiella]|uniref:frataxin homolog, mitochondrial isoform X2 n=1 Tax=Pectinophora gossypiella TaxID=13191 RepID=UPI00214EA730|nr:frataxin homolog, mitochondrial isoform X2 [Pectinophora gossypiella]